MDQTYTTCNSTQYIQEQNYSLQINVDKLECRKEAKGENICRIPTMGKNTEHTKMLDCLKTQLKNEKKSPCETV